MEAQESIYYKSWSLRPWDIVGWGLRQIGLVGASGSDKLPVGKLVIIGNVEEAAREFMAKSVEKMGRVERIYSKQQFLSEFGSISGEEHRLSETDMEAFLKFLVRDKGVVVYDGETIKLKGSGDDGKETRITQEDTTIASLKSLIADLEVQTSILERRVEEFGKAAKEAVSKNSRITALSALRSKKLAESTLSKRHATLNQLLEVFSKIEQAASQIELVRVMEASTKVLAGYNKEIGGVERVDDVVDSLREQMSQVDEVGNVLAEAGQSPVDEMEVDDELEEMEKVEREKREEKDRIEREKREEKERKEREEREKKEAEETKRRLDALEEVERQAKAKALITQPEDKVVDESTKELQRLSLDPEDVPA